MKSTTICVQIENQIILEDVKSLVTIDNQRLSEDNNNIFIANEDNFSGNSNEKEINTKSVSESQIKVKIENQSNVSEVSSDLITNLQNIKTELMSDGYEVDDNQRLSEDNERELIANEINFSDNSSEEWHESESTSNTTSAYNKSRKRTHNSKSGMFCCPYEGCSAKFNQMSSLKHHENRHSDRFRCDWDGCNFTAGSNYHLGRHKTQAHTEERPYICCAQKCDKRFKIRADFKRHLKTFHSDLTLYGCEYPDCGQTFADRKILTNHEVIHLALILDQKYR